MKGIKPDPHDIDGGYSTGNKNNATVNLADSAPDQMFAELDGMNKYLQGVKLPGALGKKPNGSFTLKEMRKQQEKQRADDQLGAKNLYSGKVIAPVKIDVPPSEKNKDTPSNSELKQSKKSDLVEDMYQSIDDFENKLKL